MAPAVLCGLRVWLCSVMGGGALWRRWVSPVWGGTALGSHAPSCRPCRCVASSGAPRSLLLSLSELL